MATEPVILLERVRVLHCEQCPRVFLDPALREAHVARHDALRVLGSPLVVLQRVTQFWCASCCISFATHRELQLHRVRHVKNKVIKEKNDESSKPFSCESCDARFVHESTLRMHAVLHEPFPHVCHCGVGYRRAQDYRGHLHVVHGEGGGARGGTAAASATRHTARNLPREKKTAAPARVWEPLTTYQPKPPVTSKTDRAKQRKRTRATPKIKPILSLAVKRGPMLTVDLVSGQPNKKTKTDKSKGGRNKTSEPNRIKETSSDGQLQAKEKPRFTCEFCNKVISSKSGLHIHYRIHTGEKPYECEICGKRFSQLSTKSTHVTRHAGARDFKCGVCDKALSSKSGLQIHARIHTGVRPYACAVCHKDFSDPSAYQRHVRTHTGVKPYACALCGKRFSDASAHIQHRWRRHGERARTHRCAECRQTFLQAYDVKLHMARAHGAGAGCACDHCGKQFRLKQYLAVHMEHRHVPRRRRCRRCGAALHGLLADFKKHVDKHGKRKGRKKKKRTVVSDGNEM